MAEARPSLFHQRQTQHQTDAGADGDQLRHGLWETSLLVQFRYKVGPCNVDETAGGNGQHGLRKRRGAGADLQLAEPGVWEQHLRLDFNPALGFVLQAQPDALLHVNGQQLQEAILRNGDAIDIGSLRLRFWLSETRQVGLRFREGFAWALIIVVSLVQVALIYWLLK